jgi:hypothetical protein
MARPKVTKGKRQDQRALEPPPPERLRGKIQDLRLDFAALTKRTPVDERARAAFIASKLNLAGTHPHASIALRDAAIASVKQSLAVAKTMPPVPGGVGYGMFYTAGYKTGWGRGTSICFDIACPTPPSGNVNTWLYLTATNRSAMGVEAFISYNGQSNTHFRVFDWARGDHWQTDIPLVSLAPYLRGESAHGHPYQVMTVWNTTGALSATNWRNQVLLYDGVSHSWHLVYQYDYAATDAQQKSGWVGSWAPIVETFQSPYSHTNPMGALETMLLSADAAGRWGSWALLSASDATVRTDNVGFHLVFLDPNYAFIVAS